MVKEWRKHQVGRVFARLGRGTL